MRVLIVEDDKSVAALLKKGFVGAGYTVDVSHNGSEALVLARDESYSLLIVDVMIPGRDGFSLVAELRRLGKKFPILFLSAKRSTEDRIEGLQKGGDDYVVKPFSLAEVLVRAQTILRRSEPSTERQTIQFKDLEMDLLNRTVKRGEMSIDLHQKEFVLLEYLLRKPGAIVSKSQILGKVWKYDFDPQTNVVDVLVCRLRNKIDRNFDVKLIKTIRGVGYVVASE